MEDRSHERCDILIGIDAGTSVIKSVAFTLGGKQIASAAFPNAMKAVPGGGVEQDMTAPGPMPPRRLRLLAGKVPGPRQPGAGASSVTGQGDGTWLIDKDGDPVGRAGCGLMRAPVIAEEFAALARACCTLSRNRHGPGACQMGRSSPG